MEEYNKKLLNMLLRIFHGSEWSTDDISETISTAESLGYKINDDGYIED